MVAHQLKLAEFGKFVLFFPSLDGFKDGRTAQIIILQLVILLVGKKMNYQRTYPA